MDLVANDRAEKCSHEVHVSRRTFLLTVLPSSESCTYQISLHITYPCCLCIDEHSYVTANMQHAFNASLKTRNKQ